MVSSGDVPIFKVNTVCPDVLKFQCLLGDWIRLDF